MNDTAPLAAEGASLRNRFVRFGGEKVLLSLAGRLHVGCWCAGRNVGPKGYPFFQPGPAALLIPTNNNDGPTGQPFVLRW